MTLSYYEIVMYVHYFYNYQYCALLAISLCGPELLAVVIADNNIHTLFSQKIALNQGKLYVVSIDYFLKAAAMILAYFT